MPIYIHIQWRCVSPKRLVVVLAGWRFWRWCTEGEKKRGKRKEGVCGVWVWVLTGFAGERVLLTCADVDAM